MKKWMLDTSFSQVFFQIQHMNTSVITGIFTDFDGEAESTDYSFAHAKFNFITDMNSIYTQIKHKNIYLKSANLLNTSYSLPEKLILKGSSGLKNNQISRMLLCLEGINKFLVLNTIFSGTALDMSANNYAEFNIQGKINPTKIGMGLSKFINAKIFMPKDIQIEAKLKFIEII